MLFGIYVVVFNFVQTSTKNFLYLTFVMKCRFSVTSHALFRAGVTAFHIAVNLGKRCFCKRGRRVFTLSFVPRIVLTKQLRNSLFSNLTTLVLWKKYRLNREWHCYYSTLIIALSVFITIGIFLDAYNIHKPSNKKFAPMKNQSFRWAKNMHINVE